MRALAELHCHTTFSDGRLSPEECAIRAQKRGLSVLAITDHNTADGGLQLRERWHDEDLIIIPGEEISTDKGHVLAYFVKGSIRPGNFDDVIKEIISQAAVAYMAHPFHIPLGNRWRQKPVFKLEIQDLQRLAGLEVVNGHNRSAANRMAAELASSEELSAISGSDAHFGFEIGNAITELDIGELSHESVDAALRKGLVKPRKRRFSAYPIYLYIGLINKLMRRRYA